MGNASKAARLYHAAYPNCRHPSRRMFNKIHQRLHETEQFKPNLIAVNRDLLELLHSRKIFFAQLKKILKYLCVRITLQKRSSHHPM